MQFSIIAAKLHVALVSHALKQVQNLQKGESEFQYLLKHELKHCLRWVGPKTDRCLQ